MAGIPSETENNMSLLFSDSGMTFATRKERESRLKEETSKSIEFMELNNVSSETTLVDYLICYCEDIDQISEKTQQKALQYYDKVVQTISEKILLLLSCGYKEVHLLSDHGFVLTGLLDESDKVELSLPDVDKKERFIATANKIANKPDNLIEFDQSYKDKEFLYFAKSMSPFKTTGAYGYSHGGICPQEILIPHLKVKGMKQSSINQLDVKILNKKQLLSIVGNNFTIEIKAASSDGLLFNNKRNIEIHFLENKQTFNKTNVITIGQNETKALNFNENKDNFIVHLLDAETKELLDKADLKKKQVRDLGGL